MSSLYEITGELLKLQEIIQDGEIDEDVLADTLEAVEGEYEIKLENCCKLIKNLEADTVALKNEANRLTDKRKSLEGQITNIKKYMFDSLKTTGKSKVKSSLFTVAIQKNGGKSPIVVDVETSMLPDDLVNIKETPNLEAIAKLLDAGNTTFAHYGERGESLRIK